jgi:hypothetical protein
MIDIVVDLPLVIPVVSDEQGLYTVNPQAVIETSLGIRPAIPYRNRDVERASHT